MSRQQPPPPFPHTCEVGLERFICLYRLLPLPAHIYASLIFPVSPAFIQLPILLPPNSSQSLQLFLVLPVLFALLLTPAPESASSASL